MRKKERRSFLLAFAVLLAGCGQPVSGTKTDGVETEDGKGAAVESGETSGNAAAAGIDTSDMFTERDWNGTYKAEESAEIRLSDDGSFCQSDAVEISGNTVTITDEGTYILSGTLTDGMVEVRAEDTDKVQLVLNQAHISNSSSAALYIVSADKVFLTLAEETENTLENGGAYADADGNHIDGTVFSKADLTLNGTGTLKVTAAAGHGIVSKDDLVITGGTYEIAGAEHGISGKDSVRIGGGTIRITAGKDGIHAENKDDAALGFVYLAGGAYEISAQEDGISAGSWLLSEDGAFEITTGSGSAGAAQQNAGEEMPGGPRHRENSQGEERAAAAPEGEAVSSEPETESRKGLKAGTRLIMTGGTYVLDTEDDSLHSNGNVEISGGSCEISSGDDGIHGDTDVSVSGGSITISDSYEGIEGLTVSVTGGEISLKASDDGLNAAGGNDGSGLRGMGETPFASTEGACISISGGKLYIDASGDGIDSNGDVEISGGEVCLSGPSGNGNGSLDFNGKAVVTGGVLKASGSSGMAQNFDSSSTQGAMLVSLDSQEAGTEITLKDSNGTEILSWQAAKAYSSVLISCPELEAGGTYTLTAGTAEKTIEMDGLLYADMPSEKGRPEGREMRPGGGPRGKAPDAPAESQSQ